MASARSNDDLLFASLSWQSWVLLLDSPTAWLEVITRARSNGGLRVHPELDATAGVVQSAAYHPEGDVLTHLGLAAEQAASACERDGVSGRDRHVAILGALLHDVGKSTTTEVSPDGKVTSRGHADAGEAPARAFLDRIGASAEVRERVARVVAEHMCHVSVHGEPTARAVARLRRRLEPAALEDWARVVDADCAGRGAGSKPSPASGWLAVARMAEPPGQPPLCRP